MMRDPQDQLLAGRVGELAREWREKADSRRAISKIDPVADALDYCASKLIARARATEIATTQLTVDQFARLPQIGVTPQTVRNWIRAGRLAAIDTVRGYRIAADALPIRPGSQGSER